MLLSLAYYELTQRWKQDEDNCGKDMVLMWEMNIKLLKIKSKTKTDGKGYVMKWTPSKWMTSVMDYFPLNYPRRTNVRTPQETESSQMIVDLPLAHLTQTDCSKIIGPKRIDMNKK